MDKKLLFLKKNNNSINSLNSLAKALKVSEKDIEHCLGLSAENRYKTPRKTVYKKDGSIREVWNPIPIIRKIQLQIKNELLESNKIVIWPDYVYGVSKKTKNYKAKDFVASAENHCGSKTVLKIDISDFFSNICEKDVFFVFRKLFKYTDEISRVLTNLCTKDGCLPQGGITSSHLATLILFDIEPYIVERLWFKGLSYSRYIDDITISSPLKNYDMGVAKRMVERMLDKKYLPINENKTAVESNVVSSVSVHGLLVCRDVPILPASYKARLRSGINQLLKSSVESNGSTNSGYLRQYRSLLGRAYFLKRLKHPKSKKYIDILKTKLAKPKISIAYLRDIERKIKLLEESKSKSNSEWYAYEVNQIKFKLYQVGDNYEKYKKSLWDRVYKNILV